MSQAQCTSPAWDALPSPPASLTARWGQGVFDSTRSRFVLFGGFTSQNTRETWEFGQGEWVLAATNGPSARRSNGLVFDARRGRVLLFGGFDTVPRNDLWAWDGGVWTQLFPTGTPPEVRDAMAAAYDEARDRVVIFGGVRPNHFYGDTWEYDPQSNSWARVSQTGPAARGYMHAAYDPVRQRTVMFGGGGDLPGQQRNDTWEWDGAAWSLRATTGPSPRRGYTMTYNGARGTVLLFGGFTDGNPTVYHRDTWEWDGTRWAEAEAPGPSPRAVAFAAYDPDGARVLFFGGANAQGAFRDFWSFTGPPRLASQSGDLLKCPAGTAVLSVEVAGTGQFLFNWQVEGEPAEWSDVTVGLTPGLGAVAGAQESTMRISSMDPAASGRRFRCVVTAVAGACGATISSPVTLTICRTDVNCDDFLDFFDYDEFVNDFESGGSRADFNGDGFIDFFDYDEFVAAFEAGC